MSATTTLVARITDLRRHRADLLSAVLRATDDAALPVFEPGAHVEMHLAPGLARSYSLSGDAASRDHYRVTIQRVDPAEGGQGGSSHVFSNWQVGQLVEIGAPRNGFPLADDNSASVFVAGGIGITPFLPMMAQCNRQQRPWTLHYCARRGADAPLLDEVMQLAATPWGRLQTHFADAADYGRLDLAALLRALPDGAHVYCCGPQKMLGAFREGSRGLPAERVHMESFDSSAVLATAGGYSVCLQRSGKEIDVKPGQTILQAARLQGVDVPASCEQGACGACETRVIEGIADHRDVLLSERERRAGKTMMICCSGSLTSRLVLDL